MNDGAVDAIEPLDELVTPGILWAKLVGKIAAIVAIWAA
jgi:hypothetical protein